LRERLLIFGKVVKLERKKQERGGGRRYGLRVNKEVQSLKALEERDLQEGRNV